jgi:hypothetical protein
MSSSQPAKMSLLTRILASRVFLLVRFSMSLLPRWFEEAITVGARPKARMYSTAAVLNLV